MLRGERYCFIVQNLFLGFCSLIIIMMCEVMSFYIMARQEDDLLFGELYAGKETQTTGSWVSGYNLLDVKGMWAFCFDRMLAASWVTGLGLGVLSLTGVCCDRFGTLLCSSGLSTEGNFRQCELGDDWVKVWGANGLHRPMMKILIHHFVSLKYLGVIILLC